MGQRHVIKQGECLSSIARDYQFASWRAIYEHPENAAFRKLRPNPNVICPGDELVIPERKEKQVSVSPGQSHAVIVDGGATRLRVRLLDGDGGALAGLRYVLLVRDRAIEGATDAGGLLDQEIPPDLTEARLHIAFEGGAELEVKLAVGDLDPIEEVTGVQARLANLGFECGIIDGIVGPRTREALRRFQAHAQLDPTGEIDDATRKQLRRRHDFQKA